MGEAFPLDVFFLKIAYPKSWQRTIKISGINKNSIKNKISEYCCFLVFRSGAFLFFGRDTPK